MRIVRACVVAALVSAAACGEYNRDAIAHNIAGMQDLRAGRLADARDKFQRAAEEDHRYALPLYNLSLAHVKQKDWANAADALDRAISRAPDNAEYHYRLGEAHFQFAMDAHNADNAQNGSHLERARTAFTNALQHDRKMYMAHQRLGQIAEALDDPQTALREYTDAVSNGPRDYMAYVRLGHLYRVNALNEQAAQVLNEALRVAPDGAPERGQMHAELGLVLLAQHQNGPATDQFLAAINDDAQLGGALFSLGMTYAEMPDRHDQAVLYLRRFVQGRGANTPPEFLARAQSRLAELETPRRSLTLGNPPAVPAVGTLATREWTSAITSAEQIQQWI